MTEPSAPDVDVVLTCYNDGQYINQAVRSILNQTVAARIGRIVLADDGSGKETISVLKQIEADEPDVSVIFGPGGAGPAEQRNRAIAATAAPFVAILDADDYWAPRKLEYQLPILQADPAIGLVYSDYFAFPSENADAARRAGAADLADAEDQTRAFFLCDPPILPSTVVLRRAAFDRAGGFDPTIRMFEETDLWLRLSRICRFGFAAEPLVYKRYHAESLTGSQQDKMSDHAFIALKAVAYDPELLGLVPRRLSERARKLGNHRFLQGDAAEAARLLRLAMKLDPLNIRVVPYWAAAALAPRLSYRLLGRALRRRRLAMGAEQ